MDAGEKMKGKEIKMRKLVKIDLHYGFALDETIEIKADDIERLKINGIDTLITYDEEKRYTVDEGIKHYKTYHEIPYCRFFFLQLNKNKVEKSLFEKIIKIKNFSAITLYYECGCIDSYCFFRKWKESTTALGKSIEYGNNVFQWNHLTNNNLQITIEPSELLDVKKYDSDLVYIQKI
mgnify:FL=1